MALCLRSAFAACLALSLFGCATRTPAPVDFSSPETTVVGFTHAAALGRARLAQSYFVPGGVDYGDIWEVLTAPPGSPRYPARIMLESIDARAPIEVVSEERAANRLKVVWRVTFRRDFEIQGQEVLAGSTYDLDATLQQVGDRWLIDSF
jgi:hypothetical protein